MEWFAIAIAVVFVGCAIGFLATSPHQPYTEVWQVPTPDYYFVECTGEIEAYVIDCSTCATHPKGGTDAP